MKTNINNPLDLQQFKSDESVSKVSTSSGEERDEIKEIKQLARADTDRIRLWRWVVLGSLLVTGAVVSGLTYHFLEQEKQQTLETAVRACTGFANTPPAKESLILTPSPFSAVWSILSYGRRCSGMYISLSLSCAPFPAFRSPLFSPSSFNNNSTFAPAWIASRTTLPITLSLSILPGLFSFIPILKNGLNICASKQDWKSFPCVILYPPRKYQPGLILPMHITKPGWRNRICGKKGIWIGWFPKLIIRSCHDTRPKYRILCPILTIVPIIIRRGCFRRLQKRTV